ncbi:MAG TPA: response regulator [Nitrososphaeraceae archaeon]|nr:response regulator [Nitrososphaeraceae archaeon]
MLDNANALHHASNLLSVLIVDDNHDIVILMERALRRYGFRVSAFTDPTEALNSLNATSDGFSLIISDIRMPVEIDDREFYSMLPDIKVDGFLQKPFSISKLNDVITKISILE